VSNKHLYAAERLINSAITELSKVNTNKDDRLYDLYADLVTAWDRLRRFTTED
jgi:hypothetical protein